MLVNWQPTLGRGCAREIVLNPKASVEDDPFHLTLLGHAEETRFLTFAALKETYAEDDQVLPTALDLIASEFKDALEIGIKIRGGYVNRLALITCKGDWPWLIEAGGLLRNFRHAPSLAKFC